MPFVQFRFAIYRKCLVIGVCSIIVEHCAYLCLNQIVRVCLPILISRPVDELFQSQDLSDAQTNTIMSKNKILHPRVDNEIIEIKSKVSGGGECSLGNIRSLNIY